MNRPRMMASSHEKTGVWDVLEMSGGWCRLHAREVPNFKEYKGRPTFVDRHLFEINDYVCSLAIDKNEERTKIEECAHSGCYAQSEATQFHVLCDCLML